MCAEVNHLKADFDALCVAGNISNEISAIMHGLLMMVELVLAIFLEKQTRKHAKNSNLPLSLSDQDDTSLRLYNTFVNGFIDGVTETVHCHLTLFDRRTHTRQRWHACKPRLNHDSRSQQLIDHSDREITQAGKVRHLRRLPPGLSGFHLPYPEKIPGYR